MQGVYKYIRRIELIHKLIEAEKTGISRDFAKKVGISRSLLMEHLRELRGDFNAPIEFCKKRQTFFYSKPFSIRIIISSK